MEKHPKNNNFTDLLKINDIFFAKKLPVDYKKEAKVEKSLKNSTGFRRIY